MTQSRRETISIESVASTIKAAFNARSLEIPPDSELNYLLEEVQKFESSTRDQSPGKTAADTDDRAVFVGSTLLRAVRLADSIAILENHRVPKTTETLKTLASFKHGNPEHESQFDESEYELHMASQFVGFGQRVSFVKAKSASRYQQRVEFMLGYKWPVECKRPRSEATILENINKAITKINERSQSGLVCVGLETALPMQRGGYIEAADESDICALVSAHLKPWLLENRASIQDKLARGYSRFLIVTYMVRSYMHETEQVALPSLRVGLSSSGDWITTNVIHTCIRALKAERAAATGYLLEMD